MSPPLVVLGRGRLFLSASPKILLLQVFSPTETAVAVGVQQPDPAVSFQRK